ncbi:MAG: aminopeptidase P N-terminal domain-containing protein, partial [Clostridium sp.]
MKKEFYVRNRKNVLDKVDDNSIVILFAGNAPKKTADEKYQFTPNRNFYYLTGISEENHILLMSKINGVVKTELFIKEVDLECEKWEGKTLRDNEALEISGVDSVDYLGNFKSRINKLISSSLDLNVYLDLERNAYEISETLSGSFAKELRDKYPQVSFKNIFKIIGELRLIKTEEEVEQIRKAIEITIEGVELLMKKSSPGMLECELEAYFDFICKSKGVKDFAFKTIAASGKNATTLHYVDNNSEMKNEDLILFDLGAQCNYYNGDISRTFPVNGKFTERQKEVYNAVLRINEKVIETMKPGINFLDLNKQAKEWIAEECIKLGLITNSEDVLKYYYHSIGHSLGMDTHDTDMPNR